jgi:hypothetical protein
MTPLRRLTLALSLGKSRGATPEVHTATHMPIGARSIMNTGLELVHSDGRLLEKEPFYA